MTRVTIDYCVPCGLLDRAVETQTALLELFGQRLETVALRPGDGGVFRVVADGEVVYDEDEEAYDVETITERVRERT